MNFDDFNRIKKLIKKYKIKSKKDLLKLPRNEIRNYFVFKKYLKIDLRLRPDNTLIQFRKFRRTSYYFKAIDLKIKLKELKKVIPFDRYKTGRSLASKVTNVMQQNEIELFSIKVKNIAVDIEYKHTYSKKCVLIECNEIQFLEDLPSDFYINIAGTAYNKNGFEFIEDYFNQSNDFVNNGLSASVDNFSFYIYKR